MILCHADKSGRVLTMSYGGHVGAEEMKRSFEEVQILMQGLKPEFLLLTDLSSLTSMDMACAASLGDLMDLCSKNGMATVMRVIPDPSKDIGFDLISLFHHQPPIRTQNYKNLAEAIESLLVQSPPAP